MLGKTTSLPEHWSVIGYTGPERILSTGVTRFETSYTLIFPFSHRPTQGLVLHAWWILCNAYRSYLNISNTRIGDPLGYLSIGQSIICISGLVDSQCGVAFIPSPLFSRNAIE